ncbi:MAG: hypothetical protein WC967_14280 [Balneolaceae bacterium]
MKEFLETPVGKIILGVIVMAVWGVNMVQFSDVFQNSEKVTVQTKEEIDISTLAFIEETPFIYKSVRRDPFKNPLAREVAVTKVSSPKEQVPQPRLILAGILDGTAILRGEGGRMFVVKEEEEFDGILVKSITPDSVILSFQNKEFVVKVTSN